MTTDGAGRAPSLGGIASVFFDWNGTLVDDRHRAWTAARSTLAAIHPHHQRRSDEAIAEAWRLPVSAFFMALGVAPERALDAERMWNTEMTKEPPAVRAGARELLGELRRSGCLVGVVSAGLPSLLVSDVAATRLDGALDVLVAGVSDKSSVLGCFAASGPLVFVGDSEADMFAATAAGALAVGVDGGYRPASALTRAGAVFVLTDLADLPAALEQLALGTADGAGSLVADVVGGGRE